MRARTDIDRQIGTPVSVMLRPERLVATAEAHDNGRSIEGIVADVVFQGATARIVVHLGDESEVIATVITGADIPFLHPAARCTSPGSPTARSCCPGGHGDPARPPTTSTPSTNRPTRDIVDVGRPSRPHPLHPRHHPTSTKRKP